LLFTETESANINHLPDKSILVECVPNCVKCNSGTGDVHVTLHTLHAYILLYDSDYSECPLFLVLVTAWHRMEA